MALENSPAAHSALLCIKLSNIRASPGAHILAIPMAITRARPGAHNLAISLASPKTFALA
jgi:hypothetical protein